MGRVVNNILFSFVGGSMFNNRVITVQSLKMSKSDRNNLPFLPATTIYTDI